jgi:hypothetical protein
VRYLPALNLICASRCSPKPTHSFLVSKIKCSVWVGGHTRARHRALAIEHHLFEQSAVFLSPMSALQHITDLSQTSRRVRKVPVPGIKSSYTLLQCTDIIARGGGNPSKENPLMRTLMPALAIALVGFCSQANAQAQCPELTRLRSEAAEASKPTRRALISDRCEAYIRSSMAWDVMVQYANDHRELCNISIHSLSEFEKYHREAVSARDNVCTGRPVRPFPPEIIQR